jgi:hypothetical protein
MSYNRERSERYREKHPDRVKKQKAAWHKKNRAKSIARVKAWKAAHPEADFNRHLRRKYGLSREQYDVMVVAQSGACGICKGPPNGKACNGREHKRFDVDHDHVTGKVRGLLCHACNVMLGQARDRVDVLQAAILWLQP